MLGVTCDGLNDVKVKQYSPCMYKALVAKLCE